MTQETHRLTFGTLMLLLKQALAEWLNDDAPRLGASLAFYTLLSLAPGIIIIVAVAAFVYGQEAAQGQLAVQLRDFAGSGVAKTIQEMIRGASGPGTGLIATVLGLSTLAFGASSVFVELHDALNLIWGIPLYQDRTHAAAAIRFIRDRLYSCAMVMGAGVLLLASLILSTRIAGVALHVPRVTTLVVTFLLISSLFAVAYKTVPDIKLQWSDVALGSAITSLLFMLGKQAIALYFAKNSLGSTYGTAGSPLVVLLWLYYSALLFYWGAEFTKVYAKALGSQCDLPLSTGSERE
jgi:membrane protein